MAKGAVPIKPMNLGDSRAGLQEETGGELGAPPPVTHLPTEGALFRRKSNCGDEG
jgi:hypothetical protein